MQRAVFALCLTIAFACEFANAIVFAETSAETLQTLVAQARDAQARGDFRSAAEAYRKATELDSSIPELWANLGLMYHQIGKRTEAIESFRRAIKLNSSLFVPQLFLGIDYLELQKPDVAIPFLETAAQLNSQDPQAELSLARAYSMKGQGDRAAEFYWRTTQITPNDGNAWLGLGTAYLQQVENDARAMISNHNHSAYTDLREAETLAEEGNLIKAENAYRSAIANSPPAPCAHAELGIALLREKKITEAREQFAAEHQTTAHCSLAPLGIAFAEIAEGHLELALKKLIPIATADPAFVQSSLPLFGTTLSADQVRSVNEFARANQDAGNISAETASAIRSALCSVDDLSHSNIFQTRSSETVSLRSSADVERLHEEGHFAECDESLKQALETLTSAQEQLLATCAFYAGDFRTTSIAAKRLKAHSTTVVQGLYWESKADQKLAIAVLEHAGEIDPDSPHMHVLIGDVYRQKHQWDDAETEYRKAMALDPTSHGARLNLGIVLFTELKTDEALAVAESLLVEAPDDPETNMLAGEILVQEHRFQEAEPYLSRCQNLGPDLVPHLHVLLGQVYAATNRVPAAISEYKLGLMSDEDGSIHYQLARLYEKSGDKGAAAESIRLSQQLRRRWDDRAHTGLEQTSTVTNRQ